jgi:truncated hemoglobin YjbI
MLEAASVMQSFLEGIGGEAGCMRLAKDFYARVAESELLQPLFPGKSVRCATEEFAAFLMHFLDGDESQTQYRWWLSLRESHARFQISEPQRVEWLRLMNDAIGSAVADDAVQRSLRQFFVVTSVYVVGQAEAPKVADEELGRRWGQQRTLDLLIEHLLAGRDADAIALAKGFMARRSVMVGILGRMMEIGPEPLVAFVVSCVDIEPRFASARFNGRTLLHFAAGASCLPVVLRLLQCGVDPDVLDSGGYTPLFRAASSSRDELGAEVVAALALAGATVDHHGGVSKSTPLHQAARFGNIKIAEALLAAGASRSAKDKRGHTPLDRARNCRRKYFAALLESWPT